jgi:hypothetical protein
MDPQSHSSSGACVVLNGILKARGSEVSKQVIYIRNFVNLVVNSSKYNHRFQKLLFIYCMSLSGCRKKPFTPYHSSYGIGQQMWKSSEIWNIIYGSIMLDNLSWSFTSIF